VKEVVADGAGGLFDGLAGGGYASGDAGIVGVQWDFEARAEGLDEGEVGVGLVTAQAMVDVYRGKANAEGIAWLRVGGVKQQQQSNRVRASGDGSADAVSGADVFAV
jgi:hypothetical protein